ncbi:hypothetical protein GCQ56_18705 [Marinifilum sp. N1E240]|uniref:hypothetical protein n=1 Tax=Marinifilum sp. N1E240 TaxID=2608082 RepID=UPI00128B556E|nr:hypothetical protein [Marinifilum sp. N1E240]MPQ49033.1 hypothetical protein [Marinifilum sp. N1E240]
MIKWYRNLIDKVLNEKPYFGIGYREGKYKAMIFLPPLVLLFAVILGLAVFFSNFKSYQRSWRAKMNTNEIVVRCDSSIQGDSIKIEWKNSFPPAKVVFYNGEQADVNINKRGYNYFTVSYLGQKIGTYEQFKSDYWSYHKYEFLIKMDSSDTPQSALQIEGKYHKCKLAAE